MPAFSSIAMGVSAAAAAGGLGLSAAQGGGQQVKPGPMEKAMVRRYWERYAPVEEALLTDLGFRKIPANPFEGRVIDQWIYEPEGYLPETTRQVAEVREQYGNLAAAARRSGAVAFPAGGGLPSTMGKQISLSQARDVAGIRAQDPEKRYGRLFSMAQLGANIPSQATEAELKRTGLSAELAMQQGSNLSRAVGGFGSTMGSLGQYYMLSNAMKPPKPVMDYTDPGAAPYWQWALGG